MRLFSADILGTWTQKLLETCQELAEIMDYERQISLIPILRTEGYQAKFLIPSKSKSEEWDKAQRTMSLIWVSRHNSKTAEVKGPPWHGQAMGNKGWGGGQEEFPEGMPSQDWRPTAALSLESHLKVDWPLCFPPKSSMLFHVPVRTETLLKEVSFPNLYSRQLIRHVNPYEMSSSKIPSNELKVSNIKQYM